MRLVEVKVHLVFLDFKGEILVRTTPGIAM